MITSEDKQTIIENLGNHYSRIIVPELKKRKVLNRYGKNFSNRSINDIVNGVQENLKVEKVIFQLIKKRKQEQEQLNQLKQSL